MPKSGTTRSARTTPAPKAPEPAPILPGIAVRRQKQNKGWCIADDERAFFRDGFENGLLEDVKFVHNAVPMICVRGYESTGEAVGQTFRRLDDPKMPEGVERTVTVIYDAKKRLFHHMRNPTHSIDQADYLLLLADGSAIAGWKKAS